MRLIKAHTFDVVQGERWPVIKSDGGGVDELGAHVQLEKRVEPLGAAGGTPIGSCSVWGQCDSSVAWCGGSVTAWCGVWGQCDSVVWGVGAV